MYIPGELTLEEKEPDPITGFREYVTYRFTIPVTNAAGVDMSRLFTTDAIAISNCFLPHDYFLDLMSENIELLCTTNHKYQHLLKNVTQQQAKEWHRQHLETEYTFRKQLKLKPQYRCKTWCQQQQQQQSQDTGFMFQRTMSASAFTSIFGTSSSSYSDLPYMSDTSSSSVSSLVASTDDNTSNNTGPNHNISTNTES